MINSIVAYYSTYLLKLIKKLYTFYCIIINTMCGIRTYFTAQAQQKDAMHHIQTAQSIKKR
ncbi:hypothetical protein GW750_01995 [bacterium]|nr:hypothetical protein [bacterium]